MSEIRLSFINFMKDQGKISELKTSSHRYQSSYTVGQQSAKRGLQVFNAGTKTNHVYESPLMESKSIKTGKDFRMLKSKPSASDLRDYMEKSINFDAFPNASPINNIIELAKNEPTPVPCFAPWYEPQSGVTCSAGTQASLTARTISAVRSTFASVADFIYHELRQLHPSYRPKYIWDPPSSKSADRYAPQMGEIPKTCQAATLAAANTCQQELARWPIFDVSVAKAQLLKISSYLEQECDFVAIIFVCTLSYITYRILSNLALLGTWVFGYVTCAIGARQPKQVCTSKYSPQVGMLTSDDGAAFTGVKPKKVTAASKTPKKVALPTQSTPGVTMLYKSYSSSFGGAPRSLKDPRRQDGPLNGFGVGI